MEIKGIHDRGYVFVNGKRQGILSRMNSITSMPLSISPAETLQIIVENQGRICYGKDINDFKGVIGNVTLNGKIIEDWKMTGYPFTNSDLLRSVLKDLITEKPKMPRSSTFNDYLAGNQGSMSFWQGTFTTPCEEQKAVALKLYFIKLPFVMVCSYWSYTLIVFKF